MTDTAVRGRTRRAILDAAVTVLARQRGATLADIAVAAEVGRTTLHRYFPDRETLVAAVVEDSWRAVEQAVRDAAVEEGPAADAMRRLISALVATGERMLFLFGDPRPAPSPDPILDLVRRGQADGAFDRAVSAEWIRNVVWSLVYAGCEAARDGLLPRQGIAETVLRTLQNGISAR